MTDSAAAPVELPLHVPVSLRWADQDAYGHINNASILRILEEARVRTFWDYGRPPGEGALLTVGVDRDTHTVVAEQRIQYLRVMPYYSAPIEVRLWISRVGGASFEVSYEIHPPEGQPSEGAFCRASATIVLLDAASGRPRSLRPEEREGLRLHLGEPIDFGKRR